MDEILRVRPDDAGSAPSRALTLDGETMRPDVVRSVRDRVRTGRYRPAADKVAEQLVAWLIALDRDGHPA